MIAVLDYGAGNLRSVQNSLEAVGVRYEIVREAEGLRRAGKIILPGVGHFGQMIRALDELDVRETLKHQVKSGVPFFGICLGLQALFEGSAEAPEEHGLGILPGRVERFPTTARVPHMGWNEVVRKGTSQLLPADHAEHFYFANSFYAPVVAATSGVCHYSLDFTAVVEMENVFGVQFHPEKSGAAGLEILRRFGAL